MPSPEFAIARRNNLLIVLCACVSAKRMPANGLFSEKIKATLLEASKAESPVTFLPGQSGEGRVIVQGPDRLMGRARVGQLDGPCGDPFQVRKSDQGLINGLVVFGLGPSLQGQSIEHASEFGHTFTKEAG